MKTPSKRLFTKCLGGLVVAGGIVAVVSSQSKHPSHRLASTDLPAPQRAIAASTGSTQVSRDSVMKDLEKSFHHVEVIELDPEKARANVKADGKFDITINGQSVELKMVENELRSPNYFAEESTASGPIPLERTEVITYKGVATDSEGSIVRLSLDGSSVQGYVQLAGTKYYIEPASRFSPNANPNQSVVYKQQDAKVKPGTFENELPSAAGGTLSGKMDASAAKVAAAAGALSGLRVLEVATDADFAFVNALGGVAKANAEALNILNMVDGAYQAQLGLTISVTYQTAWSSADPYAGASADPILRALQTYWEANHKDVPRDTVHLFTGQQSVLSQGYAFVGTVCRFPSSAYGLSGYVGWYPGAYLITAHEIGHNLGADHVDATQGCANTLMNAALSGSTPLSFCQFSRDVITAYVAANGSCLTPVGPTPSPSPSAAPYSVESWGISTDKPLKGKFFGSAKDDLVAYRAGTQSYFYVKQTGGAGTMFIPWGVAGDVAHVARVMTGTRSQVLVFRPSSGIWYAYDPTDGRVASLQWGTAGDITFVGNFQGLGTDDVAVFRESDGMLYIRNMAQPDKMRFVRFGAAGDRPVVGDFLGRGHDQIAQFRNSDGNWYIIDLIQGDVRAEHWGTAGDIPVPARYLSGGRSQIAIYRRGAGQSGGTFWIHDLIDGRTASFAWGAGSDVPIALDFDGSGRDQCAIYQASGQWWIYQDLQ